MMLMRVCGSRPRAGPGRPGAEGCPRGAGSSSSISSVNSSEWVAVRCGSSADWLAAQREHETGG